MIEKVDLGVPMDDIAKRVIDGYYKHINRLRNYHKLTNVQKNEILLRDCKFCGTQRCHGIFDEECGEGCSMIDKYFKDDNA